MFLTIPVSKLLDSDLEIGVDPHSGNFTYNIKDAPPRLHYGYAYANLMLTLQCPTASDGRSRICLRVCTNSTADSVAPPSSDTSSPALEFASAPVGLLTQSDTHLVSSTEMEMTAASITAAHGHGVFTPTNSDDASSPFSVHSKLHQGTPEPSIYQPSPWDALQEANPQSSQETNMVSPSIPGTSPSSISSGFTFEDAARFEPLDFAAYSNLQYSTDYIYGNMSGFPARSYSSESTIDMIDNQDLANIAFGEVGSNAAASCVLFATTDFSAFNASVQNSPLPRPSPGSGSPSPASSLIAVGVTTKDTRPAVDNNITTSGASQEPSTFDAFPTASVSIPESVISSTTESRPPSRQSKIEGFPCPFATCDRVLKSLYTQQLHMKTHAAKPRKNFACTMGCSESFTRHHDRLRHEVSQHGKQCEFSCKRCDRFFSSQRMLDRHTCWSSRIGPLRWQLKDCSDPHSEI